MLGKKIKPRILFPIFFLCLNILCPAATADEVRPGYLELKALPDLGYEVIWKQPVVEKKSLPIDPVFPTQCILLERSAPEVTRSAVIKRWSTTCDLSRARIEITGLRTSITDVMVRHIDDTGSVDHYIVQPAKPTLALGGETADTVGYLMVGVAHLIGGVDHVLFVLGLVLLIRSPWMLIKAVTAFTAAHSITLALSIFGVMTLAQAPVEAVIALSIVFLARELVLPEHQRSALTKTSPWLMAFLFGLLHGLGFAGVLREIGLPQDALFTSLLLFNVGIELGQILIITAFLGLLWLWRKASDAFSFQPHLMYVVAAYSMGSVAAYWTIDRTVALF